MIAVEVVVPQGDGRRWHEVIIERLRAAGHPVQVRSTKAPRAWAREMDAVLRLERRLLRSGRDGLACAVTIEPTAPRQAPALMVDLSGTVLTGGSTPVLSLRFDDSTSPGRSLDVLLGGGLPTLSIVLDGRRVVGTAYPMLDKPTLVGACLEDVLARAISLSVSAVERFATGRLPAGEALCHAPCSKTTNGGSALLRYCTAATPRLAGEIVRLARYRPAHWRIGYRFGDGPGVAEIGALGTGWSVLPDRGDRFLADPFPFTVHGRSYLFVEDFPHATGKGVISVVEFDEAGRPTEPQPVLEEPYHLSYPQVFRRDGAIWMLPESSSGANLVLYRAERFPDRWVRHAVLFGNRQLSDATLLEHEGRLWLFATDRDGFGSTSDMLVVFSAERMGGPWVPHRANPIVIDRRAARPGGAFIRQGGKILLPVQDGTLGYGGGLGLSELLHLDQDTVQLSPPVSISATGDWPYPKIHTLNRVGRLEVIDGIAPARRW